MYVIQTEASFDAAHFLNDYDGKCSNIHGHRWRVLVKVRRNELENAVQTNGMVVDFSDLKEDLKREADQLDHTFIIEKDSLSAALHSLLKEEGFQLTEVPFRPTAEHFARFFYEKMKAYGYEVDCAVIFETPNNCAEYRED